MLACMLGGYVGIERDDHTLWRCAGTLAATEIHRARGRDPARRGDRSRQFLRRIKGIDIDLMSHRDCGQPNNAVLRLRCVRRRTQTKTVGLQRADYRSGHALSGGAEEDRTPDLLNAIYIFAHKAA